MIILCGLQSSGKTTFGKFLSEELNCAFVDTDQLIESVYAAQTGKHLTCREIHSQEGSTYFRSLEKQEVTRLNPIEKTVIATGGGTLETPENLYHLKTIGKLIYLQVPLEIIWKRMKGIPAYLDPKDPEKSFYEIAKKRTAIYEQVADLIIPTN